jgi:protein SCO1/2
MTTAGHTAVSVARSLTRTRSVGRIPSSLATRRLLSSNGIPKESNIAGTTKPATPPANDPVFAKTSAGSGKMNDTDIHSFSIGRGPVSWPALGLVAITAASLVAYYKIERERRLEEAMGKIVSTGRPAIGGPWTLVDLNGNLVTNKQFEGKWLLLYFGFARCPDICPSEMLKVGKVMDTLAAEHPEIAKQVVPVFVSVDPARDSLKALREYGKDFHPSYIFLTGSPEQVQQMAKKYRVYVSKADETEDGDYLVDHSIVIYFHDETGELADCFTQSMRPSDIVDKILERMAESERVKKELAAA